MKRLAAILMATSMCGVLMTGCGSPVSDTGETKTLASQESSQMESTAVHNTEPPKEETTLKLAAWDYTGNDTTSNVVAAFEAANPNIKVEVIDIPSTDYNTKLNVMLNGGSDLDAFFVKEAPMVYDFYKKGQALDLAPLIKKDNIDLTGFNGTDKAFNIEGGQYALTSITDYNVLYYNKEIFDAAGEAYPSNDMTWDEFEALARKMTKEKVYGAHFHTWATQTQNWGIQDGQNTVLDYKTGYDFLKTAYERILRMQEDGIIQEFGYLKSANIHCTSAFKAGNVAMMPMGSWFIASMKAAVTDGEVKPDSWGVATLPHPENTEAGQTVGTSTSIAINAASAKRDAAWEFVKFVTGEEGAAIYAKSGTLPGRVNDTMLLEVANLEGSPEGLAEALAVTKIIPDRPVAPHVTEMDTMMAEEHSMIMLGEISLEDGLKEMSERSKEIQE